MSLKPEYVARLKEIEEARGKKGSKKLMKEDPDIETKASAKKKKGGKNKKDPADQFDPLNFKPTKKGVTAEDSNDLTNQLANYEYRCSACPFGTNVHDEFKTHFKCEWHKINTQRKVAQQPPLSEEEFKELVILKEFA